MQLKRSIFAVISLILSLTVFASLAFAALPDAGLTQDDFVYQDSEKTTLVGIKTSGKQKIVEASKSAPKDTDGSSPVAITIPEGTKEILKDAFNGNVRGSNELALVKEINFPASLEVINTQAFQFMPLTILNFKSQPTINRLAFFYLRNYVNQGYIANYQLGNTYSPVTINGLNDIKITHYIVQSARYPLDNNDGFTKDDGSNTMTILKTKIPGHENKPFHIPVASYKGEDIYQTNPLYVNLIDKKLELNFNGVKLNADGIKKHPELKDNTLSISEINDTYLNEQISKLEDLLNYLERPAEYYEGWFDNNGQKLNLENLKTHLLTNQLATTYTLKAKGINYYGLDANGGKFSDGSTFKKLESFGELTQAIVSEHNPQREGYTFVGWKLTDKTIDDYKTKLALFSPRVAYAAPLETNVILQATDYPKVSPNSVLKAEWKKSDSSLPGSNASAGGREIESEYTGFYNDKAGNKIEKSEDPQFVEKINPDKIQALPKTSEATSFIPALVFAGIATIALSFAFKLGKN